MKPLLSSLRHTMTVGAIFFSISFPWGHVLANDSPLPVQVSQSLSRIPHLQEAFTQGSALWRDKQWAASASAWQGLLAQTRSQFGDGHITTETAAFYLGDTYREQGHYQQALPLLQRAAQAHERQLGDHAATAISLEKLALVYTRLAMYQQALDSQQKGLSIREKVLGADQAG